MHKRCASIALLTVVYLSCQAPSGAGEKIDQSYLVPGKNAKSVQFPEEVFVKAKVLKNHGDYKRAEELLMGSLEQAKQSSAGTIKLAKYLTRLNNTLYQQAKDDEAIKYGIIAEKLFDKFPEKKERLIGWLVNIHSYLGLSYHRKNEFKLGGKYLLQAIELAESAPPAKVDSRWLTLIKTQLADCQQRTPGNID